MHSRAREMPRLSCDVSSRTADTGANADGSRTLHRRESPHECFSTSSTKPKMRHVVKRRLARGTVVILTTIPPRHGLAERSAESAEAVQKLAAELNVPLIDYLCELHRSPKHD